MFRKANLWIVFGLLPVFFSVESTNAQTKTKSFQKREYRCSLKSTEKGQPPNWDNRDLHSATDREKIIRAAIREATGYLAKCYPDVAIGILLNFTPQSWLFPNLLGDYRTFNWTDEKCNKFKLPDEWCTPTKLMIRIDYAQIQRMQDTAALTKVSGYLRMKETIFPLFWVESESYTIDIVIYPEVFERGELHIPNDPEQPWARDPIEAMVFVILHELGHVESYITNNSTEFKNMKIGDTEADAWNFAASVFRCSAD